MTPIQALLKQFFCLSLDITDTFGEKKKSCLKKVPGTCPQGSRKSKNGWELIKSGCHARFTELSKKPYIDVFKLIPFTVVFFCIFLLLDQFGYQPPLLVDHFGWWTLISESIAAG